MSLPQHVCLLRTAILTALLTSSSAFAQSIWTGLGLDGDWSNEANWLGGITPDSSTSTALQFDGLTLLAPNTNAAWTIGSIAFNSGSGAFVLGGSALTLANGGTVTNNSTNLQTIANSGLTLSGTSTWNTANGDLRVSSAISGGGTIVKTGAGTLELSGVASDFGTLAANEGRVTISAATTLGTLAVGAFGTPGTSGNFSLTGGTLNTSKGGSNTTYIGGGAGNTGTMIISGGTLNVGLVSAPGTRADFEVGSFSGNGTVTQTGGALALNSTSGLFHIGNQGTGVYNLESGTLTVKSAFALGRSNTSGLGNGTFNISGGSLTLSSATKGALLIGGVDGTGAVNGGTGLIHQTGGTITVGQYMEFGPHGGSGTYDLLGGTLEIGGANGIRAGSAGSSYAFNLGAGTLKVVGSDLTTSVRGTLVLGASSTLFDTQSFNATWAGGFDGSNGVLAKIGTGTLTLSTADSSFGYFGAVQGTTALASGAVSSGEFIVGGYAGVTGTMTMSGGQLNIGVAPLGGGTPSLRIGDFGGTGIFTQTGGTVDVNNASGAALSIGNQGGGGTYSISAGTLHLGAGGLITLGRSTGANAAGAGTFNVSGNALVDLEGGRFIIGDDTTSTNNGSGVVNQTGGTVRVGSGASLYLSGFAPTNGGTNTYNLSGGILQVGGTSLKGVVNTPSPYSFNLGGGAIQVLGSDLSTSVNVTLVSSTSSFVDTNGLNATFSGTFTGSNAQLVKTGAGNLALTSGSNAIASFFVIGGNVNQTTGGSLTSYEIGVGSGAGKTGSYTMSGGSLIAAAGTPPSFVGGSASSFRVGDYGGTGTFTQTGGTVTVTGSMNIGNQGGAGTYNLSGGTLSLGGGLHDLGRTTGTDTASSGTINLSGGILELVDANARLILGDREGTGLQGTGVLTQTGGILRITAGDLWLSSRGNGAYNLNGGTLEVGGNGLQTFYQGTGSGTGTYAFNLGGGTIKVIGSDLTVSANATLTSGRSSSIDTNGLNATLSGTLTGTNAQFVKTGAGNLALTATSNAIDSFFVTGGNVNQTTGKSLTSYEIGVGSGAGKTGSYTMSGGSLIVAAGTPPPLVGGQASNLRIGDFGGTGTFTQTGGAVTVNGSLNVGNQGGAGTYDLSAGTLTLQSSGQSVLGRTSGSSASSGGSTGALNLSGTGVLNITDTAKLVLSNWYPATGITQGNGTLTQTGGTLAVANTAQLILTGFGTGTYNLNGGTLRIGGSTSLEGVYFGESGAYHFHLGGGTIQVAGSDLATDVAATLTAATTSTIDTNSFNATFSGALDGAGSLLKNGPGTLTLSGANTYTGGTAVSAGTLAGTTGSLQGAIVNNAAVTFAQTTNGTYSGAMSGGGSLTKSGTGTVTLSGANTYSGGTSVTGGLLQIGADARLGSGALTLDGGGIKFGAAFNDLRAFTLGAGGATLDSGTFNVTYGQVLSGNGTLTIGGSGSGSVTLTANNAYTGGTIVAGGGTLRIGNGGTTGSVGNGPITCHFLNVSPYSDALIVFDRSDPFTLTNDLTNPRLTTAVNTNLTLTGAVTGAGFFSVGDNSVLRFAGVWPSDGFSDFELGDHARAEFANDAGSRFSSLETSEISSGTSQFVFDRQTPGAAPVFSAGRLITGSDFGSELRLSSGANVTSGTVSLVAGEFSGNAALRVDSGVQVRINQLSRNSPFLEKTGDGTLVFGWNSGDASLTGKGFGYASSISELTISGGTVQIGTGNADADSFMDFFQAPVHNNATLAFNFSDEFSLNANVDGTGSLMQLGTGTLRLPYANSYGGATLVSAGTLRLDAAGALPTGTPLTLSAGATLDLNGHAATVGKLEGAGTVLLQNASLTVAQAGDSAFAGAFTGNGGLVKSGAGTLALTGVSTYSGPTTVSAGRLKVNGSIASSGLTTVSGTGTLSGGGAVGDVSLNSGGTISPGNSPGTMTTGDEAWEGGASYVWEINRGDGSAGADPGWDFLEIDGSLTINSTMENPFVIRITSLTLANAAGNTTNLVRGQIYTWIIATADQPIADFNADKFFLNTSAFFNDPGNIGGFAISRSLDGLSLNLTYTAIPENGTWAAAALLFLLILFKRRRV